MKYSNLKKLSLLTLNFNILSINGITPLTPEVPEDIKKLPKYKQRINASKLINDIDICYKEI